MIGTILLLAAAPSNTPGLTLQPEVSGRMFLPRLRKGGWRMLKTTFGLAAVALASTFISAPASAANIRDLYVSCLSQTQHSKAMELLQANAGDAAQRPYRQLAEDSGCFAKVYDDKPYSASDAAFSIDMLRGKLAERALASADAKVRALEPLPLQQKRYERPWFAATGRNTAVDEMGACMADTDPAGIIELIGTEPDGSDESAAIGAMSQALTKCLSAGTRLDASRQALRAALADALYQRLYNPALSAVITKGTPK